MLKEGSFPSGLVLAQTRGPHSLYPVLQSVPFDPRLTSSKGLTNLSSFSLIGLWGSSLKKYMHVHHLEFSVLHRMCEQVCVVVEVVGTNQ